MSIKRRKFLKAGTLATLFAAMPLKQVLGQSWKNNDGNPSSNDGEPSPLANYSRATFASYLNSIFQIHTSSGIIDVTLGQIRDMPAPSNGECFTLLFRGEVSREWQSTYPVTHPSLGAFQLFLVRATDEKGAPAYLATINRLSLADSAMISVPAKSTQSPNPLPRAGNAASITWMPPSPTPASAPEVVGPRGQVRKSSWKIFDLELDQDQ